MTSVARSAVPIRVALVAILAAAFAVMWMLAGSARANAGLASGLSIAMSADDDAVDAGGLAAFTIRVWNAGPEQLTAVRIHDELPIHVGWHLQIEGGDVDACNFASSGDPDGQTGASFGCDLGNLPASDKGGSIVLHVSGVAGEDTCGMLDNAAWVEASGEGRVQAEASIAVNCPTPSQVDEAPVRESVLAGVPPGGSLPDTGVPIAPRTPFWPAELLLVGFAASTGALAVARARSRR